MDIGLDREGSATVQSSTNDDAAATAAAAIYTTSTTEAEPALIPETDFLLILVGILNG